MPFLATGADLIADALRKSGELQDGTSDYTNDALAYLNNHYQKFVSGGNDFDVDMGDPWPWAKAKYPGTVVFTRPYHEGYVTVTFNSNQGVFSVPPAISQQNNILSVDGEFEYYRIIQHTAGSPNFTLDSTFNNYSQSSQPHTPQQTSAFKSIKLYYDLIPQNGDLISRLFGPLKVYRAQTSDADYEGKIVGLDIRSFERKYPWLRLVSGTPTEFCPIMIADGVYTIQINKFVWEQTKADFDYIPIPPDLTNSSTSVPIIPLAYRECLSLATAYSILKDKEDSKAEHFMALTKASLMAMTSASRREFMQISKNRGRLLARGDDFGVRNWPTSGDLNS